MYLGIQHPNMIVYEFFFKDTCISEALNCYFPSYLNVNQQLCASGPKVFQSQWNYIAWCLILKCVCHLEIR